MTAQSIHPPARRDTPTSPNSQIRERPVWHIPGGIGLIVGLCLIFGGLYLALRPFITGTVNFAGVSVILPDGFWLHIAIGIATTVLGFVLLTGLLIIQPGEAAVIQFLGTYLGTVHSSGLIFTFPCTSQQKVSMRVHNFETSELKVNESEGNPINIAAIIVWQIADTAKSVFAVEDYRTFVTVQSEAALRHVATTHPYDNAAPGEETLRGSTELVASELAHEVANRIALAGLEVVEARISTLAYAPEIAQSMLQRQQASAVIAARELIVEGAVSIVHTAIERLETDQVVNLNNERKAVMISNLLVMLCSESRSDHAGTSGHHSPSNQPSTRPDSRSRARERAVFEKLQTLAAAADRTPRRHRSVYEDMPPAPPLR